MKTSNKIFISIAVIMVVSLTYSFVNNGMQLEKGGVLGKNDTVSLDELNFDDKELDSSLQELDSFLDTELDDNLDTVDTSNSDLKFEEKLDQEITQDIDKVEYDLEVATSPKTTRKTTKLQKLLGVIPVKIPVEETVTDTGFVVARKQTLLGKLLDLFSF